MTRFVLCDKQGNKISWLEATVRTFRIIGHPATIDEIYNVMVEEVVTEIPRTSKTPRQTIYGQIYTHSHDSKAGKGKQNIFYSTGIKGVWGLLESKTLESDITANEENREFPEGKAIFEIHLRHERNVQLVKDAKKRFLEEHDGQIFCEACGFNFYQVYGDIGRNFIEVHHLSKPVATMKRGDMTKVYITLK